MDTIIKRVRVSSTRALQIVEGSSLPKDVPLRTLSDREILRDTRHSKCNLFPFDCMISHELLSNAKVVILAH